MLCNNSEAEGKHGKHGKHVNDNPTPLSLLYSFYSGRFYSNK